MDPALSIFCQANKNQSSKNFKLVTKSIKYNVLKCWLLSFRQKKKYLVSTVNAD